MVQNVLNLNFIALSWREKKERKKREEFVNIGLFISLISKGREEVLSVSPGQRNSGDALVTLLLSSRVKQRILCRAV